MKKIICLLLCIVCFSTVNAQFTVQKAFSRVNYSSTPFSFGKRCNMPECFTIENPNNVMSDKLYLNFQLTEYYLARDLKPDATSTLRKKFRLGNDVELGLVGFGGALEWETYNLITVSNGSIVDALEVVIVSGLVMPKQFKINDNREVFVYRLVPESKASINMSSFNYVEAHVTETIYTIDMAGQFILTTPEKRVSSTRTYSKEELESDTFNLWDQY